MALVFSLGIVFIATGMGFFAHADSAGAVPALPAGTVGAAQGAVDPGTSMPATAAGAGIVPGMPAAGAEPPKPGMLGSLLPFGLMFGIFYFLMIRPQQKKAKEQAQMLSALKDGDEVITASGILGKITGMTDKVVTMEVDDSVHLKILRTQVSQVVKGSIRDLAT